MYFCQCSRNNNNSGIECQSQSSTYFGPIPNFFMKEFIVWLVCLKTNHTVEFLLINNKLKDSDAEMLLLEMAGKYKSLTFRVRIAWWRGCGLYRIIVKYDRDGSTTLVMAPDSRHTPNPPIPSLRHNLAIRHQSF